MLEVVNSPAHEHSASDSDSEQNLRRLLKDVEKLRRRARLPLQAPRQAPLTPESSYVDRFLERARAHYANQDFKASLEILHDGLKLAPGNAEILALADEVRKASEMRQTEMEESGVADRIAQCKAEAIKLFEEGRYSDCIERFKILSELDPTNSDLRHYLEVSCEQAEKMQSSVTPPLAEPVNTQEDEIASKATQIPEPELPAPSKPESLHVPEDANNTADLELSKRHSAGLLEPSQEESVAHSTSVQNSAAKDSSSEYPVAVQVQQLRLKARKEDRKRSEPEAATAPKLPGELSEAAGTKSLKVAALAGVGLVIGAILGIWLALVSFKQPTVPAEVSLPPESNAIGADQAPAASAVTLPETEVHDPQAQAQKAFQQGRLLEANRFCESILQSTPENPFALDLKKQIRERYLKMAGQAVANQKWADASLAWHNLLKVYPGDPEAARQLKAVKANLKKEEQLALAGKMEAEKQIGDLHQQITLAMRSGRHLPPSPGNAFELIQQLEALSSEDAFVRDQRNEILRHLVASASRTLQAKDSVRAGSLVRQIETYFPQAADLKSLRDGLKAEQARLAEARNSWMQKAEAAMAAGHFVTPASDNVVAYCSELLALEPQNAKALELKKASAARAGTQAKTWIQEEKYDEARAVYSALLYLPQAEIQFPLTNQEIKAEIEKLTFNAYAVVHDHALGSCTGRLRFNGYQLAYVPSSDSKDGFSVKMTEVSQVESEDKLKIQIKGKTYRFQINGVKDSKEIRARISDIQRQISGLVASK